MKLVKCIPEFEFFTVFLKNRNIISKIKISKVTDDYAALIKYYCILLFALMNDVIKANNRGNAQNMKPIYFCVGFIFCTLTATVTAKKASLYGNGLRSLFFRRTKKYWKSAC